MWPKSSPWKDAGEGGDQGCGRVMDLPYAEVDRIAKLVPSTPLNITLDQALNQEPQLKN